MASRQIIGQHRRRRPRRRRGAASPSVLRPRLLAGTALAALLVGLGVLAGPLTPPRFVCAQARATAVVVAAAKPMTDAQWQETVAVVGEALGESVAEGERLVLATAEAAGRRPRLGTVLHDDCLTPEPSATDGRREHRRAAATARALAAAQGLRPGTVVAAAVPAAEAAEYAALDLGRGGMALERLVYVGLAGPSAPASRTPAGTGPEIDLVVLSRSYREDQAAAPAGQVRVVPSYLPPPRDADDCLEDGVPGTVAIMVDVTDGLGAAGEAQLRASIATAFDPLAPERRVAVHALGADPAASGSLWRACLNGREADALAGSAMDALTAAYGPVEAWDAPRSPIVERLVHQRKAWGEAAPDRPDRVVLVSDMLQSSANLAHKANATVDYARFATAVEAALGKDLTGLFAGIALDVEQIVSRDHAGLQTPAHDRFVETLERDLTAPRPATR